MLCRFFGTRFDDYSRHATGTVWYPVKTLLLYETRLNLGCRCIKCSTSLASHVSTSCFHNKGFAVSWNNVILHHFCIGEKPPKRIVVDLTSNMSVLITCASNSQGQHARNGSLVPSPQVQYAPPGTSPQHQFNRGRDGEETVSQDTLRRNLTLHLRHDGRQAARRLPHAAAQQHQ